jgi:GDP-mannose 6-dehydrogenase
MGVDVDAGKIANILASRAPFYEPGLEAVIASTVASGTFTAGTDIAAAVSQADIALICVGTPSASNGNLSTEQLQRVLAEISKCIEGRTQPLIVAIRSTVFPGTTEELTSTLIGNPNIRVVANPEFLREGVAIRDFDEPSLLVVGGEDSEAVQSVADLYLPLGCEPCLVSLRTAEMIKYCCNAFHALKIAFANEVGALALSLSVSPTEVMDTLCQDMRLNISAAYLKPGFAFGGSCLPKDLRALTYRAMRMDLKLPLLESVLPSNDRHLDRGIAEVTAFPSRQISVFGLAFKENTDDLRESPVVSAIEHWIGKGRDVRVFDPHIEIDQIYGSNRNFIMKALPHIGRLMTSSIADLIAHGDCIVVAQKPSAEFASAIVASGKPVIDLVGAGLERAVTAAS